MRFSTVVSFLALAGSSVVTPALASGISPARTISLAKRLTADVCAVVDVNLLVHVKVCLCASAFVGNSNTNVAIRAQIGQSNGLCTYPAHGYPTCKGNACDFECNPPFIKDSQTKMCKCPTGQVEQGDNCVNSPSLTPKMRRRRTHTCSQGLTACAVPGVRSWDCVNTTSDLESCGGCTLSLDAETPATGVDCSVIPHVSSVACVHGSCLVLECRKDFVVDSHGSACISPSQSDTSFDVPPLAIGSEGPTTS